ncbi:MAG: hypothetical protein HZB92_09295 [Euryarchaeota archaeon]|nr:hypothetical protein [Euryarchaeota archaeon]
MEHLTCPLKFGKEPSHCIRQECAWYSGDRCAINAIAENLRDKGGL